MSGSHPTITIRDHSTGGMCDLGAPDPRASHRAAAVAAVAAVARRYADQVDASGRFPSEAVDAMREHRLLGCALEEEVPLRELSMLTMRISAACASAGMIFAMHQSQALVFRRHGETPAMRALALEAVADQWLLASCTTERATRGDVGQSRCSVLPAGETFTLQKDAPVISYGEEADAILITARRDDEANPDDQVLALIPSSALTLSRTSTWDATGMRGTCSHGFEVSAFAHMDLVFTTSYGEIASTTEVPASHTLWSAAWLGIATESLSTAIDFAQRRKPASEVAPATLLAMRLAELRQRVDTLRSLVRDAALTFDLGSPELTGALRYNQLKMLAADTVVDVTTGCLRLVGIEGYLTQGPFTVARHVRDALSAPLMISNERLLLNNARIGHVKIGLYGD